MQQLLTFSKINDNNTLRIAINQEGLAYLEESENRSYMHRLGELLEWHVCNGWDWLSAEQLGALTSSEIILSDDVEIDDMAEITNKPFTIYWFDNYQVKDPFHSWKTKGYIDLTRA